VREDAIHFPNFTPRAVCALLDRALASFCVSTNHDGLVNSENVVEIFGSVLTETCLGCKARFRRKFAPPPLNRKCELCGEKLKKTGCRYGQSIYRPGLERAEKAAAEADVALVLGSGMHTWPVTSSGFPKMARSALVLVTLGPTAADHDEGVTRLDSTCDAFMSALMSELQIPVPDFEFSQSIKIRKSLLATGQVEIQVSGENNQEALSFCHEGRVVIVESGKTFDLERSNLSYNLSAEFALPAAAGPIRIELIPRPEFGDSNPHMILLEDSEETFSTYRRTIISSPD
jgi:hypothetical protein